MIIGFVKNIQTVPEARDDRFEEYILLIDVHSKITSERSWNFLYRLVDQPSGTNIAVVKSNVVGRPADVLYSNQLSIPLEQSGFLDIEETDIYPVRATIINDVIPEEEECFTLTIARSSEYINLKTGLQCDDASGFYCQHKICIIDNDGKFHNN